MPNSPTGLQPCASRTPLLEVLLHPRYALIDNTEGIEWRCGVKGRTAFHKQVMLGLVLVNVVVEDDDGPCCCCSLDPVQQARDAIDVLDGRSLLTHALVCAQDVVLRDQGRDVWDDGERSLPVSSRPDPNIVSAESLEGPVHELPDPRPYVEREVAVASVAVDAGSVLHGRVEPLDTEHVVQIKDDCRDPVRDALPVKLSPHSHAITSLVEPDADAPPLRFHGLSTVWFESLES